MMMLKNWSSCLFPLLVLVNTCPVKSRPITCDVLNYLGPNNAVMKNNSILKRSSSIQDFNDADIISEPSSRLNSKCKKLINSSRLKQSLISMRGGGGGDGGLLASLLDTLRQQNVILDKLISFILELLDRLGLSSHVVREQKDQTKRKRKKKSSNKEKVVEQLKVTKESVSSSANKKKKSNPTITKKSNKKKQNSSNNLGNSKATRVQKEIKLFMENENSKNNNMKLKVGKNMRVWIITMKPGGIYGEDKFKLRVQFPDNYPMVPPSVYFLQPTPRHEHVYTNGDICLSLLGKDWRPTMTAHSIALSIYSILASAREKSLPMDNAGHCQNKPGQYQENWVYHDDNC